MSDKGMKFKLVIEKSFVLIERVGVENITISLLANESGVSRGWIYKYMGGDIESVLRFCVKTYAHNFAHTVELKELYSEKEFESALLGFAELITSQIEEHAFNISIYFKYLNSQSFVGEIIREMNHKYLLHMAKNIQNIINISEEEALIKAGILHTMRMGGLQAFLDTQKNKKKLQDEYFKNLKALISLTFH